VPPDPPLGRRVCSAALEGDGTLHPEPAVTTFGDEYHIYLPLVFDRH